MLELKEKKDLFSIVVFFCYYGSSEIKIVMELWSEGKYKFVVPYKGIRKSNVKYKL
jgi:hypothetical protein